MLQQIKSHLDDQISSVRVLMMTALGADDDRLRGGIEGAVQYLVKPVGGDRLRAAVLAALEGLPEADQRRRVQTDALVELARRESGGPASASDGPRPRLSRLEHPRARRADEETDSGREIGVDLTEKQRNLLRTLGATPSVKEAAAQLGVSRSNVYASLRRVARKIDAVSVPDLLRALRSGELRVLGE